jgi:hypothetical protein
MAHFAELKAMTDPTGFTSNAHQIVQRVVVVGNDCVPSDMQDDGEDPVVWTYVISWNETKYNADNTKGWEAIKSNDEAETPTTYDWNGTAWVSA